jgi:stress-induced-phosphoprotein 1
MDVVEEVQEEEEELEPEERQKRENKKLAVAAKEEGNELYKAHKFDEAIAAYNRAIELDPTEMAFITNRAGMVMAVGSDNGDGDREAAVAISCTVAH